MGERFRGVEWSLDGKPWGCPVAGQMVERADGRIKVLLDGWAPL